ncbi:MAG: hypothetical protein JSU94_08260 [Phycisphaerales bacterium]|nr:MAG: hypothetical protein JSU94_08260 [Phycisphaerales bacterium]
MAITLETIHKEIQQVKSDLHRVRSMLEDEGELADEARRDLARAREEVCGEYLTHEEVVAKYG